jgi:diacylglycerol kinase family enzyme
MNPVSGGISKNIWEVAVRDYFRTSPHSYELYNTSGDNDLESIKYWIDSWHPDKVVALGGDGTVKLAAEALFGRDIPLCIFPAGSANGMARELKMPSDPAECFRILLEGNARHIDVIMLNNETLCIHLSDIGMNAQLVKYFEENDVRGKIGYAREVMRVLWKKRLISVAIKKDDTTLIRTAFMVVLANASVYGTGAKINPIGDLHDGLFEVIILRKLSLIELLKMLFFNRPFNPNKTEMLQAEAVTIEVSKKAYFQVDGEYMGKTRKISARVERNALMLIFPPENQG